MAGHYGDETSSRRCGRLEGSLWQAGAPAALICSPRVLANPIRVRLHTDSENTEQQLQHEIGADPGEDVIEHDTETPFDLTISG